MKRRLLAIYLIILMLACLFPQLTSAMFNDIAGHWAENTIVKWLEAGVLNGYADGSFRPSNYIKRSEFFKVIDAIMAYQTAGTNQFPDLKKSDWYYDIVLRLAAAGIIQGDAGSGTVRGEAYLKREEAFAILARVFQIEPDAGGLNRFVDAAEVSAWAQAEVGGMAAAGYVQGHNGRLRPQDFITRAEVMAVIDRIIDLYITKPGVYGGKARIAVVKAPGAVLDGAEIRDIFVTAGVGSGELTLRNTKVTGTVNVSGNSLVTIAGGSTVNCIKVTGNSAGIVVDGRVDTIVVTASNINISGEGQVATVLVESGTGNAVKVPGAKVIVAEGAGGVDLGESGSPSTPGPGIQPGPVIPPPVYPPPAIPDPFEVCAIEEIELNGEVPGLDARTFGGKTQLRITAKKPGSYYVYVTVDNPEPAPDPNFDRNLLLVPELADLMLSPAVKAAVWESYEQYLASATEDSDWYSQAMQDLSGAGQLEKDLFIIGFRTTDGSTPAAPATIAGYGGAPVASPSELTDNSWMAVSDGTLLFVVLYPEPAFEDPPELVALGSARIFTWPPDIDYDPNLDNNGILPGTHVYACFELDENYSFVKMWNPPESIEGYTKVDNPADMGPNTWCVLTFGEGSSAYSYVLVWGKVLFPVNRVTSVAIGAPYNLEFAARDTITLEEGKTVNLTALLSATGTLPDETREVTWTVAELDESVPTTEFTAKIKVTVVKAVPFKAKPALNVINKGIRSWSENPVAGDVYLAFTSDVHYDRNATAGENLLRLWMENLGQKVDSIDYLTIAGDLTSAYASSTRDAWENIKALMEVADLFKGENNVVKHDNLFVVGNHEHWTVAGAALEEVRDNEEYEDLQDLVARLYETGEEPIETDSYIIVPFGAEATEEGDTSYGAEYGSGQKFRDESLAALEAYLETAPKDRPIFVVSHYPIHTYGSPEGGDRVTTNSLKLINVLNKYPNVLFVWGHNHSSADPMYDKVYGPGDFIQIGPSIFGETARINFFYMAAGCMSDFEYRSSASSTSLPGGIYVKGKGMLVGISGSDVNIMWYDRPQPVRPDFKLPAELGQLAAAATARKTWYGASAYRLNEEIVSSGWVDDGMIGSGGWAVTGTVLGGGNNVVILGFKGSELDAIASSFTGLSGYDRVDSPSSLGPGKWGMVISEDGTMVFVILYALSDGNIWIPRYIGDAQVLSFEGNTITLWDGVDDGDATNWNGTVTWDEIAAAITALGEVTTTGSGEAFNPENAGTYTITANGVVYRVVSGVPETKKFVLPAELEELFATSYPDNTYYIWFGYEAVESSEDLSLSAIRDLKNDLATYGDSIVFIGINQGLLNFADLLPNGLTGYKKAPLASSSITSAAAFAAIKDAFVPGTWFYSASGSASYLILYPFELPVELREVFATSYPDNTYYIWFGYEAVESSEDLSLSAIRDLKNDLATYGDSIVFIGINQGLLNFADLLPNGLTGYKKAPLASSSITSAAAFAAIKDAFVPGTWFYSASGSASYLILYPPFADSTISAASCTECAKCEICGLCVEEDCCGSEYCDCAGLKCECLDNPVVEAGLDTMGIDLAIQEAEAAKADVIVSEDGRDVPADAYWVTPEEMQALEEAISAALAAKATAATQQEIDAAIQALEKALADFNSAIKADYEAIDTMDDLPNNGENIDFQEKLNEDTEKSEYEAA